MKISFIQATNTKKKACVELVPLSTLGKMKTENAMPDFVYVRVSI